MRSSALSAFCRAAAGISVGPLCSTANSSANLTINRGFYARNLTFDERTGAEELACKIRLYL